MTATTIAGALGVLLNQVFIWPQVLRARHTTEGIALLTVLSGLIARSLWLAYGFELNDLALICGSITVATGFFLLALLLARAGARSALPASLVGIAGVVLVTIAAPEVVLGAVAVIAAAVVNLPQMARALADRERLAGVSVATYLLIAAASTAWLVYGTLVREPFILAPHVVLLPTALITALVAWRQHKLQPAPDQAARSR